ncbi:hypothetical protein BGP_4559 [Beggiatoa sp. PS]|nr:hypothetical protein BGP_4559 [Beggiatoa sp. PS]
MTITANWEKLPLCSYELTHLNHTFEASGGDDSIRVETITQQCIPSPWNVIKDCDWLKITNKDSDRLNYSVESNPSSNTRVCTLTVAEDKFTVVQEGNQPPPITTLTIIGSDYGSIFGVEGYDGRSNYTKDYDEPVVITLTAKPVEGASFERWRGDNCNENKGDECTIVMDQDRTVTADFGLDDVNLKIIVVGNGNVTVNTPSQEKDCPESCKIDNLNKGDFVVLTATADDSYKFGRWFSEDCSDTNDYCRIYIDESKVVTAHFLPKNNVIACFDYKVIPTQENPLVIKTDASCSRNGKIDKYEWKTSDNQSDSGQIVNEIVFAELKEYNLTLTVIGENGTKDQITKKIPADNELAISGLKNFYYVGDHIVVDLIENIEEFSRFERVDLWVVVSTPENVLLYKVNDLNPFSSEPQPLFTELEKSERTHRIFDFVLGPGKGGEYIIYAAYVAEGKNPMKDGLIFLSNLVVRKTILSNYKNPKIDIDVDE